MSSTLNLLQYNNNIIQNEKAETIETITETMSKLTGYPSSTYIELTIGSGNSYTAPANGWFWAHKSANGTGQDFAADVYDIEGVLKYQLSSHPNVSGYIANVLAPVLQGDVMLLTYSTLGTTYSTLRFIYAADNS